MTGAQASSVKTLSEQAHDPGAYAPDLTKAEASKRIDALKRQIRERGGRAGGGYGLPVPSRRERASKHARLSTGYASPRAAASLIAVFLHDIKEII